MTPTAFAQLAQTLADALRASPDLAGLPIYTGRPRPLPQDHSRAINLRLAHSQADRIVLEAHDWRSTVVIECAARGPDAPAQADALLQAVYTRLHTLPDAIDPVGALSIDWDYDAEDTQLAVASLQLEVLHRTPIATLKPWP